MSFFNKHKVYRRVPRGTSKTVTGKQPIKIRWIDINKGDEKFPNYRSRLVAKEINRCKSSDMYAATPPLESIKFIISMAASTDGKQNSNIKLMVNDVKRAYFYAPSRRRVFIELPEEDYQEGDEEFEGELDYSMYGTRDAAQNWENKYSDVMINKLGFTQGKASPCHFFHIARGLRTVVHGDDFLTAGDDKELKWMKAKLEQEFDIKTKVLSGESSDEKEVTVLNRIIRWTSAGYEYEADARHAVLIIRSLGLELGKGVVTPGTEAEKDKEGRDNVNEE